MTPQEKAREFEQLVQDRCHGYNVFVLASQTQELKFEVHSVEKTDPKNFEDLKKELLNQFDSIDGEKENDKGGAVVNMPVSSKGADS